jgi:hypothetical protein
MSLERRGFGFFQYLRALRRGFLDWGAGSRRNRFSKSRSYSFVREPGSGTLIE